MTLTVQRIREDVADVLGEDPLDIPAADDLVDYGLDSVRLIDLVERWRREHGVDVSFVDLADRPAIDAWVPLLGVRQ
ncbi:hypothetical protein GCM10010145_33350 [Streptomyces ruber]|uniref:Carrier domain-containing protein n=2 Tax=Streptomyces TaxID=1883 RepID=A0A918BDF6_9ACTN|nr:phosphopantetheine-binding protein [Streptomyces ruber]GGQ60564.1 hypothetical protein GCM10010145_33350 [Streptomyces ruber]